MPEPETPVTAVSAPSGMSASTSAQVVQRRAAHLEPDAARPGAAGSGTAIRFCPVRYWPVSDCDAARHRPRVHHPAAALARAGAELEHEVRLLDRREVVLHDEHRVAAVAQPAEQCQQAVGVARVQSDRGLVQHVQRVHQPGAERVGERDPLRLAAGQRAGLPVERQVAQPHIAEEAEPRVELVQDQMRDLALERRERRATPATRECRPPIAPPPRRWSRPPIRTASASGLSRVPPQSPQVFASWYCRRKTRMYCLYRFSSRSFRKGKIPT